MIILMYNAYGNQHLFNTSVSTLKYHVWLPSIPIQNVILDHDLYSLSGRTSYHKISRSLEAARFGFRLFQSL